MIKWMEQSVYYLCWAFHKQRNASCRERLVWDCVLGDQCVIATTS